MIHFGNDVVAFVPDNKVNSYSIFAKIKVDVERIAPLATPAANSMPETTLSYEMNPQKSSVI